MRAPITRRVALTYVLLTTLLAITGAAQLPLLDRYRPTSTPWLGWLGDYWLTHRLHYAGAVGLLFLCGYVGTRWLLEWRRERRLQAFGVLRALTLVALCLTGAARMLKNLPSVSFSPRATQLIDCSHLLFAVLLGTLAVLRLALRAQSWRPRGDNSDR